MGGTGIGAGGAGWAGGIGGTSPNCAVGHGGMLAAVGVQPVVEVLGPEGPPVLSGEPFGMCGGTLLRLGSTFGLWMPTDCLLELDRGLVSEQTWWGQSEGWPLGRAP